MTKQLDTSKLDQKIKRAYTEYLDLRHTHDDLPYEVMVDLFSQKVKEILLKAYKE